MAQNFLISYTGRVGSTALADSLKMIPGFLIPIFEELDFWHLEHNGGLDRFNADNVSDAIDSLYSMETDIPKTQLSIGFKWRIWGNPLKVEAVLKKWDVLVLNMMRGDIFEMASSLYLSNVVHKDFNSHQFQLVEAVSSSVRDEILHKYRSQMVRVDPDDFYDIIDSQIDTERNRIAMLTKFYENGVSTLSIIYEDFAFQRFHFLNGILAAMNCPGLTFLPDPAIKKVTLPYPSELFENRTEILKDGRLIDRLQAWDSLVHRKPFPKLAL